MKIQISVNQPDLAGFLNINVAKYSLDLSNIDNLCEDSECTHILINDVLKFISYDKIPEVIQHLAQKLRHKGILQIIFTDVQSIIREYNRGELDDRTLNELLFSGGAKSSFSYQHIIDVIKNVGLKIKEIDTSREQVIIVGERE